MVVKRARAPVQEALQTFAVARQGARVDLGTNAGPFAAALARTAVEIAAAQSGAAVIITRERAAGAALRGAREVGAEPRIVSAKAAGLLSARTPLSLAMQGDPKAPEFAAASAFVGEFAATRVAAGGQAPGQTRAKVQAGLGKAREAAKAALDFEGAKPQVQAMFQANDPLRKPVVDAVAELERAESSTRVFRVPVSWPTLLAPAAAGRRAAVYIDLAPLAPAVRDDMLALSLASLSAAAAEVAAALAGGPLVVVADHPSSALGRFAAQRLASPDATPELAALVLLLGGPSDHGEGEFALSAWDGSTFALPSGAHLPLAPAPAPSDPLEPAEARALTPPPLRARLLGAAEGEPGAEEEAADAEEPLSSERADESLTALKEAGGDLETIARRSSKPGTRPRPRSAGNYEASDFEL